MEVVQINWEEKKELVESGEIDCIMGCFSMEGRLDDYRWAGPYIASRQVVAVNENSDIYKLSDLEGKNLAVQSTTKPEGIFLNRTDERIPKLGNLISLGHRELIYTFLGKGYVDAVAAHEESVVQYMKDYDVSFRILEEPLMITGIGVAFAKDDDRGICEQMSQTLEEMRQAWENKRADVSTKTLLWDAFFAPQRFRRFQENIGMDIAFRDFYFLLYEGMKKYEEVQSYFAQNTEERKRVLRRILERGKERKEIAADVDIESCVMMTLAMQDGILALKVLDETIDDEEKYRYMEEQLWRDIAAQDIYLKYLHGGVNSAVS